MCTDKTQNFTPGRDSFSKENKIEYFDWARAHFDHPFFLIPDLEKTSLKEAVELFKSTFLDDLEADCKVRIRHFFRGHHRILCFLKSALLHRLRLHVCKQDPSWHVQVDNLLDFFLTPFPRL